MGTLELFGIGVGLAMDCFAVSVCYGFTSPKYRWRSVIRMAAFFGGFQAAMPVIGWLIGLAFASLISQIDHWIAFGLLTFIAVKMVVETIRKKDDGSCIQFEKLAVLLSLSVATSIDALIVGMGFAFLKVNILWAILIIGLTSAGFTFLGTAIGKRSGKWLGKKAEIIGAIVLFAIGLKILLEHLLSA